MSAQANSITTGTPDVAASGKTRESPQPASKSQGLQHRERSRLSPHLRRLEDEAIHILREVVAEFAKPVMLYSVGKDSSVMLHLARKAFFPAPPPFPFLHIATGWDFQALLDHRDRTAAAYGLELLIHGNHEAAHAGINPFDTETGEYSRLMLTEALKAALDAHGFDAAFGGGRRDEEKARAKERIFSHRSSGHVWDPRNQRPELWRLFNTRLAPGDTMRVFPLSNWTELDVWTYIQAETIPIVPLYLAAERSVVARGNSLIAVDDDRMRLLPGETVEKRWVRFRTLGCWPLTGALDSTATNLDGVITEIVESRSSERQGRLVDSALQASMERKKREGYF
jgi:sulfate adenylyltransferase subunit 2